MIEWLWRMFIVVVAFAVIVGLRSVHRYFRSKNRVWCLHEHEGWVGLIPRDELDHCSRSFWKWRQRGGGVSEDATLAYRMDNYGAFRIRPNNWQVIYLRANNSKLYLLLSGVHLERREFFFASRTSEAYFADAYHQLHGRPVPPEIVNGLAAV